MLINISEKELYMSFDVDGDGVLKLINCSNTKEYSIAHEKDSKYYTPFEIQITGQNQNDHHGAKNTVTSATESLRYEEHRDYRNKTGRKLEIVLRDAKIEATLNYQFYDGISVVRAWTEIKNISNEKVGVEYVTSFSLLGIDYGNKLSTNEKMDIYIPSNAWVREVVWNKYTLSELGVEKNTRFSTKRISVSNTGTWSTKENLPMGCVVNKETNTAYMWQIESNSSWQWEISDIADRLYVKLSGPNERDNHWYKEILPGAKFESVKAAIVIGEDFDTALAEMTRYRRKIVRINQCDKDLPIIFNDYMHCLWADPTTKKMLPIIDIASELGAEYYCMDAGWYADGTWWECVGEWQPCKRRFENGIREVFDYIRTKGMVPGIWLEIEVMGINCPLVSEFDDECFFMRHGKRIIDHGRYQFDFRNEKVRRYATSVIDRVVNEYGVGYIKMDYNIDGGIGTEVNSDSCGDGLLGHAEAVLKWLGEIMDKYPNLIIENCSSGGMRMDYATLSVAPLQSMSDQENYHNMAHIAAAAATAVLPEQAAVWSCPTANEDNIDVAFNMINSMLLRMHLSGEVMNLTEEKKDIIKEGVKCYKMLRSKIKDFIPFYPMGVPKYTDDMPCAGYHSESCDYLSVWRMDTQQDEIEVKIPSAKEVEIVYPSMDIADISIDNDIVRIKLKRKYSAIIVKVIK